ncbi:Rft protein-domain-containing protein [Chaetomium fimeti]|uniref:Man(5)GlcNAc(2)-PP-dolichol translocation protein RFT1 n=1 Tax=Chaetomium fimeti TaxID=1854472 RepID=A0AAE0H7M9_9PEZI|nr:Rft protein-domain-containing protein [Chaetomium fimeti]
MSPKTLDLDLSRFPKLSREQAGHVRHFWNISTSIDGEWPHMGTQDPDQAFLDAYRYQLATMAYGAGVAHYHRLPAMRSLFQPLIRNLIRKMLRREVWSYWYLTSQSGNRLDPGLEKLRQPWADPVVRENIMYSGHLLMMTSLYAMLFDDDEFERPGSLTFEWDPLFWGMGPESFSYDNRSLQGAILKEMERGGWAGVANAFMNTWNSEFVRDSYDKQALGFITNIDGHIELHHPAIGATIRQLVREEQADPSSAETLQRARDKYLANRSAGFKYMQPLFGYVVEWLSELGKSKELGALLSHADAHFSPTWDRGGLYYPRQDQVTDESCCWKFVDPFTGNAAIGYARLNVEDGQKKMWDKPWTRGSLAKYPWVDDLDLSQGVDCLRGCWVEEEQAMVISLRAWDGVDHKLDFSVKNLPAGHWGVYENGLLLCEHQITKGDAVEVSTMVCRDREIDVVVVKLSQLLGVSAQLEVYYLSVLFFARESLRVAIQRQDSSKLAAKDNKDGDSRDNRVTNASVQAVVNLGYLAIALGIPLAFLFGWLYLGSLSTSTLSSAPNLVVSLYIYALAAVVELVSEPAFVVMQNRLQFGTRATAESTATFLRCVVTLGSAVWGANRDLGVLPFALGQLSYGLGLLAVYTWHGSGLAKREGFSLLPRRITALPTKAAQQQKLDEPEFMLSYFYRPTLQLASSMMAQSLVKHILTQGDTFLVSILSTPTAQGVYALANNYGSLLARLVFQPIEESSRSYFSRLLAPSTPPPTTPKPPGKQTQPSPDAASPAHAALQALQSLLRAYLLLSLAITALGPAASPPLLALVAGPRWAGSGAADCLAAYMWYVPLLAVNGVAEAFVASVASEAEVHRQSAWMGAFSVVFGVAGFVFLRVLGWGAVGLVVANGINMACRIVWCVGFIKGYFGRTGLRFEVLGVMPSPGAMLAAAVTSQVVKRVVASGASPGGAREAVVELVKVAVVAVPFVIAVAVSERRFLHGAFQAVRGHRQSSS